MKKSEYLPHLFPFLEGMWRTEEFKIKRVIMGDGELEGVFVPKTRHKVVLYFRRLKRRILTGRDRPDFLSYFCGGRLCGVLAIILLGQHLNKDHKDADVFALEAQMSCRRHLPFTWDGEVYGKVAIKSVEELDRVLVHLHGIGSKGDSQIIHTDCKTGAYCYEGGGPKCQ